MHILFSSAMLARPPQQPSQPPRIRGPMQWQPQELTPRRGPSTRSTNHSNNLPRSSRTGLGEDGEIRNSDPFELEYDLPSPSRSNYQQEFSTTRESRIQNQSNVSEIELNDGHHQEEVANESTAALVLNDQNGRNHHHRHHHHQRSSSPDQTNEQRSFLRNHHHDGDRFDPPLGNRDELESSQSNPNLVADESMGRRGGRSPIVYPYRNGTGQQIQRGYGASENRGNGGYL